MQHAHLMVRPQCLHGMSDCPLYMSLMRWLNASTASGEVGRGSSSSAGGGGGSRLSFGSLLCSTCSHDTHSNEHTATWHHLIAVPVPHLGKQKVRAKGKQ